MKLKKLVMVLGLTLLAGHMVMADPAPAFTGGRIAAVTDVFRIDHTNVGAFSNVHISDMAKVGQLVIEDGRYTDSERQSLNSAVSTYTAAHPNDGTIVVHLASFIPATSLITAVHRNYSYKGKLVMAIDSLAVRSISKPKIAAYLTKFSSKMPSASMTLYYNFQKGDDDQVAGKFLDAASTFARVYYRHSGGKKLIIDGEFSEATLSVWEPMPKVAHTVELGPKIKAAMPVEHMMKWNAAAARAIVSKSGDLSNVGM